MLQEIYFFWIRSISLHKSAVNKKNLTYVSFVETFYLFLMSCKHLTIHFCLISFYWKILCWIRLKGTIFEIYGVDKTLFVKSFTLIRTWYFNRYLLQTKLSNLLELPFIHLKSNAGNFPKSQKFESSKMWSKSKANIVSHATFCCQPLKIRMIRNITYSRFMSHWKIGVFLDDLKHVKNWISEWLPLTFFNMQKPGSCSFRMSSLIYLTACRNELKCWSCSEGSKRCIDKHESISCYRNNNE